MLFKTKQHVNVCISWTAPPENDFAFLACLIWFIITGSLQAENLSIFYKEQTKWTWWEFIKETLQFFYVIITFSQRKLLALMKIADFNKDSQLTLKSPHLCLEANFFCLNVVKFLCFKSGWCWIQMQKKEKKIYQVRKEIVACLIQAMTLLLKADYWFIFPTSKVVVFFILKWNMKIFLHSCKVPPDAAQTRSCWWNQK